MKESSNPHAHAPARPEWPLTTRRAWRKRESKVSYHPAPPSSTRRLPSPASSHEDSACNNEPFRCQPPPVQTANLGYCDVPRPGYAYEESHFDHVARQQEPGSVESAFFSSMSYTLPPDQSGSTQQIFTENDLQSPVSGLPQIFSNEQDILWTEVTSASLGSDIDNMHMSDLHFGSFGSLDSMGLSTPDTTSSSMHSEDFVFPIPDQTFGPSGTTDPMTGLAIPGDWYKIPQAFDPSSPGTVSPSPQQYLEDFPLDNDFIQLPEEWTYYGDVYPTSGRQGSSSSATLIPQQTPSPLMEESMTLTLNPWTSQLGNTQYNATSGVVTFQEPPGPGYDTHVRREEFLDTGQSTNEAFRPDPVTPGAESESDGWAITSYPSSYAASHGSPHSHGSPPSHPPSPPQDETEHQHIFSSRAHEQKVKPLRGRQRGLTELEKKQARDVRDAKACWACHISKTKCSPCSPGKPCEQCARLAGKRRFCRFSCFNDPLESLTTLLVPKYLNGHFTQANVENFVTKNATGWGNQCMFVRLYWGYQGLIEAEVVALNLRPNAEMGFHHQTKVIENMITRPILVRKNSPPLGIPLAAVDEMQNDYSRYIQNIVQNDIAGYVPIAYVDQDSELPERLLAAICCFYSAGREIDNESDVLRRVIEMHVTAVILERSLTLDEESLSQVQQQLCEEYPEGSAPRCAQRQIKLAFFMLQEKRIMRVLKDWGSMMWSTSSNASKDLEWATAFTVFLMMILVTDKILGAAWYFCEGNIEHRRNEATAERRKFQELVDLTEKELFARCKEIFHWKFKTRKGGKEACNPIRDGIEAFSSKSKSTPVDSSVKRLVWDLQEVVRDFEVEIRSHRSDQNSLSLYTDAGRLACIFLDDFMNR